MKTEYEDGLRTVYQINAVSEMTLHFYGGAISNPFSKLRQVNC